MKILIKRVGPVRLLSLLALLIFLPLQASAATKKSDAQSISIAPFLKEVRIDANEPAKSFNVSLTNDSKKKQEITLSVLNFGSLDESGGVVYTGSDTKGLLKKYGLAGWLHLARDRVTVAPNQTVQVLATITNDKTLQAGGHYGAIIASVKGSGNDGDAKVSVNQKLSSLIFATKLGGEKYDLKLDSVTHNGNTWSPPNQAEVRFYNPGNVHVVPRGVVKLVGDKNEVISQGIINQESGFVLPETYRQITVPLNPLKSAPNSLVNSHKLQIDYRYDGIERFASKNYNVRWFNSLFISLIVLLVGAIFATSYFLDKNPRIKAKILSFIKQKIKP